MKDFYLDNYAIWTESELIDAKTREELESIADNDDELRDRFTHPMTFGTSGMRALMRAGYNGMNVYTVRCASQGLAETILKSGKEADGIVIAHDSRHNSSDFARDAAVVFAANGIKVYYFEDLRPTPQLSFAVRELGCIAGVNITASHNPKEYNGYKVYWSDGAQVGVAKADEISDEIIAADIFDSPKLCDFDEAVSDGRIVMLDNELDEKYIDCVLAESVAGDYVEKVADDFKVVYAAFHGAGAKFVPEVLKRLGIKKVFPVAEQMIPDGDFPTVISPNPENPQSYDIAIRYAESTKSDMIIGTDPDSDRCGVAVRTSDGFRLLSGNQVGLLLLDYVLQRLSEEGKLPSNGVAIRSLVSTNLCDKICEVFGIECVEILTGFKYVGEKIKEYEATGEHSFVFGFEESIGYLKGTYTRDKDAVLAAMLLAEMGCFYKAKGMSVYEGLGALYDRYGYSCEKSAKMAVAELRVSEIMAAIMNDLRKNLPGELGYKVLGVKDYLGGLDGFDSSDMLNFSLDNNCTMIIRPSGTEPIIKVYAKAIGSTAKEAEDKAAFTLAETMELLEARADKVRQSI